MDTNYHTQASASEDAYVHRFPAEWRSDEELLNRLTHAVAIITDRQPERVDLDVLSLVDPDSLDRLFAPEADGEDAQVVLMISGFEIQIRADGSLLVIE